ncbi:MAG: hypothetical protein JSR91_03800 [Proteobacteria bacterium]|nr:hypothetical protein [Pseudomonadota bacterium]
MRIDLLHAIIIAAVIGYSTGAVAQSAPSWSDIDCSQSKIVAPSGLRCRMTEEINGSSDARFNGQGVFRNWATFGKKGGNKLYYLVYEGIGPQSYKQVFLTLEEEIKKRSPYAKKGRDFTSPSQISGGDYERFIGSDNGQCVAIRKFGPTRGRGYKWVLFGSECTPPGKGISDQEIARFIQAADFRA